MNEYDFTATAQAPSIAAPLAVAAIPSDVALTPEPAVPTAPTQDNVPCQTSCDVNVYIDSNSSSNNGSGSLAVFDLVLNVNWTENGEYKSAKVIKTVAFDKNQLLSDALSSKVTVVESKHVSKQERTNDTLIKMRELAGIPGKGTFVK